MLEQFKNSVSDHVATYVSKRKPVTAYEAAVMADEFFLIHKTSFGSKTYGENLQKKPWRKSVHSAKLSRDPLGGQLHVFALSFSPTEPCNYCHVFGHWKNKCTLFKTKGDTSKVKSKNVSPAKPVALAVNAPMLHDGQKNCT